MQRQLKYNLARLNLLNYIAQNQMKAGDKLPPEHELVKLLNCSSITVRAALQELATQGFIDKQQGIGSFLLRDFDVVPASGRVLLLNFMRTQIEHIFVDGLAVMRHYLRSHGMELDYLETSSAGISDEVIQAAKDSQGIILYNWVTAEQVSLLQTLKLPMLVLGNIRPIPGISQVELDIESGVRDLTASLLHRGFRTFGLITERSEYYQTGDIIAGVTGVLREAGIELDQETDLVMDGTPDFFNRAMRLLHGNYDALVFPYRFLGLAFAENWQRPIEHKPHLAVTSLLYEARDGDSWFYRLRPGVTLSYFPESEFMAAAKAIIDIMRQKHVFPFCHRLKAVLEDYTDEKAAAASTVRFADGSLQYGMRFPPLAPVPGGVGSASPDTGNSNG